MEGGEEEGELQAEHVALLQVEQLDKLAALRRKQLMLKVNLERPRETVSVVFFLSR